MPDDSKNRFASYTVDRQFGPSGDLVSETHCCGMLQIGLVAKFSEGRKTGEMYFLKGKPATRKKYEAARSEFSEMPPADGTLEDPLLELKMLQAHERRESSKYAKKHRADSEAARRYDAICAEIIMGECCEDASLWIKNADSRLGEMTRSSSRELVRGLVDAGAVRIVACKIDRAVGYESAGELVVVLPADVKLRRSIFKIAANLAIKLGFEPTSDDGQTMVYMKLD